MNGRVDSMKRGMAIIGVAMIGLLLVAGAVFVASGGLNPSTPISTDSLPVACTDCSVVSDSGVSKPTVQVWGGDVRTAGDVRTSTTSQKVALVPRTFGSWIEYGIFAAGAVEGAGSGATLAGPGQAHSSACKRASLTFVNTDDTGCTAATMVGQYNSARSLPDVAAAFPGGSPMIVFSPVIADSLLTSGGTYVGTHSGDLTLAASVLQPGKSIIIKTTGTVTITGNQTYALGPYAAIDQLPQLVIIANKIVIESSVTQVDAWIVGSGADGIVETCDTDSPTYELSGGQRLTSAVCARPLQINGPIIAKALWLRRTANGGPAEVINLRPDAYLWARAQAVASGRLQTTSTNELSPR